MTDTAPAYVQALDQLRRERDTAEKELALLRDELQSTKKLAEIMASARDEMRSNAESLLKERDQLQRHVDSLGAKLREVAAERDGASRRALEWRNHYDDICARLGDAKNRIVDLEAAAELEQLRPEVGSTIIESVEHARTRAKLVDAQAELQTKLKSQSDALNQHWQGQVKLAKAEGRRRVRSLAAMIHAHVNAIAGEEP